MSANHWRGVHRVPGESADQFYARIADAYRCLDEHSWTPTMDMARIARVPHSTAAKWIKESRRRGFLEPTMRGNGVWRKA